PGLRPQCPEGPVFVAPLGAAQRDPRIDPRQAPEEGSDITGRRSCEAACSVGPVSTEAGCCLQRETTTWPDHRSRGPAEAGAGRSCSSCCLAASGFTIML